MKFLADMGVSASVASWLSEIGHDVVHVRDVDPRSPDMDIMEKARTEGRVVLTFDLDFGDILASIEGSRPSIVLFRLRKPTPDRVRTRLGHVIDVAVKALESGAIVVVDEFRERVRKLPIK